VYLLINVDTIKLVINKIKSSIKLTKIQILKNNIVIKIGIVIQTGDKPIKCLNILIQVNKKGIIINKYILSVLNHFEDKLFMNFEINRKSFILLLVSISKK